MKIFFTDESHSEPFWLDNIQLPSLCAHKTDWGPIYTLLSCLFAILRWSWGICKMSEKPVLHSASHTSKKRSGSVIIIIILIAFVLIYIATYNIMLRSDTNVTRWYQVNPFIITWYSFFNLWENITRISHHAQEDFRHCILSFSVMFRCQQILSERRGIRTEE